MRILLPLLLLFVAAQATKIVVFCLELSNSQLIWNKRVAESLATQKDNDVTLVVIRILDGFETGVKIDKSVKVKYVEAQVGVSQIELERNHSLVIWDDVPMWDSRQRETMNMMKTFMVNGCESVLQNKEFLNWLKTENFDVAFAHMYDSCPIGLIHYAQIPSWVWLNSGLLMDFVADSVGVPLIPSYIPPMMMESHSKMSFFERTKSFIGHGLMKAIYPHFLPKYQTELFRKHISPDFPDLLDIARSCPLVMVNSNELYELARPTLHKVVNIGGIGMQFKDAKPLKPDFQKIVDEAKGVILMSFGSVARADLMPQHWKEALMEAFGRFPEYQFIFRYDSDDMESYRPKNVHLFSWLPQNDLLKHPKTVGFISHGGYNSLQETLSSGKPMVTIALFGDQPKNAKTAEYLGFGVNIPKSKINADFIEASIRKMIDNKKYGQTAERISQMIRKKPIKPEELLHKWTAFLGEFKTLENLAPYGTNLNLIKYHSLDVIAFLAVVVLVVVVLFVKIVKFIAHQTCGRLLRKKVKSE